MVTSCEGLIAVGWHSEIRNLDIVTNFQLPDSVKKLFGDTVMILAETTGNIKVSYLTGDNDWHIKYMLL